MSIIGRFFNPVGSFLRGVMREATGEALGRQVPEFVRKHVVEGPQRERLMRDIYTGLHPDDSVNLRRRIAALGGDYPENWLINELCKIYRLTDDDPLEMLRALNDLDDNEFNNAMNLLYHDAFFQYCRYVMDMLGLRKGDKWARVKASLGRAGAALGAKATIVNNKANDLAVRINAHTDRRSRS